MDKAKTDWTSKFRIPTAIGAVDCTHVHIMKPSEFSDEYVNRKGKTTINVQKTCDANEKIVLMLNGQGVYLTVGFGD